MKMRSVLFSPADRPDRVRKAMEEGLADVVVADLEDGVAPDAKDEARTAAADVLAMRGSEAVRAVRINQWPSDVAEADLAAVLPSNPELIVVPKVESTEAVRSLGHKLDEFAGKGPRILLILETARGILHAEELAMASDRVVAIAFGAEDLAADMGMGRGPENVEVFVPRAMVAIAAAAAKVQAIDMITADFTDIERCTAEAEEAKGLGFSGKMCIHPNQVKGVQEAFQPRLDELDWAMKVVDAAKRHGIGDGGVVAVDGEMIDVPLIEQAKRMLRDVQAAKKTLDNRSEEPRE